VKTSTKFLFDRLLGGIFCFFVNGVAQIKSFIFRRNNRVKVEDVKTICVAKYVGLGSITSSIPLLAALKKRCPNAKLVFITGKKNKQLIELVEPIDEFILVDESSIVSLIKSVFNLIWQLQVKRPDVFIDLEIYSYFSSLMTYFSLAHHRIGFYRKSTRLKEGLYTKVHYFNIFAPASDLYLTLGTSLGIIRENESHRVAEHLKVQKQLKLKDNLTLVVNPNASDLAFERRWPKENFSMAISNVLDEFPDIHIKMIGTKNERMLADEIITMIPNHAKHFNQIHNTCGELTIPQLLQTLSSADCVLTNDSGPMHFSFSLERPSVALFGPVHPRQYTSLANPEITRVFYRSVICSPCVHQTEAPPCGGDNICMKGIDVNEVSQACIELLKGHKNLRTQYETEFSQTLNQSNTREGAAPIDFRP
jgi:ADP-heptose:LPS heptosyltransferase